MTTMRWHYDEDLNEYYAKPKHGELYYCDHVVYSRCTLYKKGNLGLAVIQQRYKNKLTYWAGLDPWLVDKIFENPGFEDYFFKRAGCRDENGLYPTVTVRQIMWALRMKPLRKDPWETVFDRKDI